MAIFAFVPENDTNEPSTWKEVPSKLTHEDEPRQSESINNHSSESGKSNSPRSSTNSDIQSMHKIQFKDFTDVRILSYGCGFLGWGGNKGAVGISFSVGDTPLAFIGSHLASGEGETDVIQRNADYSKIVLNAKFSKPIDTEPTSTTRKLNSGIDSKFDNDETNSVSSEEEGRVMVNGQIANTESYPPVDALHDMINVSETASDNANESKEAENMNVQPVTPSEHESPPLQKQTFDIQNSTKHYGSFVHMPQRRRYMRCGWRFSKRAAALSQRSCLSSFHETVVWLGDFNYRIKCAPFTELHVPKHISSHTGNIIVGHHHMRGITDMPDELLDSTSDDPLQQHLSLHDVLYFIDTKRLDLLIPRDELQYEIRRSQGKRRYDAYGELIQTIYKPVTCPYTTCDTTQTTSRSMNGTEPIHIEPDDILLFEGFREGPLCFPPTYKYVMHTTDPQATLPTPSAADVTRAKLKSKQIQLQQQIMPSQEPTNSNALQQKLSELPMPSGSSCHEDDNSSSISNTMHPVHIDIIERDGIDQKLRQEEYQRPQDYNEWYCKRFLKDTYCLDDEIVTPAADTPVPDQRVPEAPSNQKNPSTKKIDKKDKNKNKSKDKSKDKDSKTGQKLRCPAWCDRILWRDNYLLCEKSLHNMRSQTTQHSYERLPHIYGSDHKMVRATYTIHLRRIDEQKEYIIYKEVRNQVKKELRLLLAEEQKRNSFPSYLREMPYSQSNVDNGIQNENEQKNTETGLMDVLWDGILSILPGNEPNNEEGSDMHANLTVTDDKISDDPIDSDSPDASFTWHTVRSPIPVKPSTTSQILDTDLDEKIHILDDKIRV